MPEILGPFSIVSTNLPPLDAHIAHLRHLINPKVARMILREQHGFNATDAKKVAPIVGAHVRQGLEFHEAGVSSSPTIRPVLQYYSYLNLAVAVILAHKPPNHNQYRHHGVEDKSHSLSSLELSSTVLKVKQGAVPLFHSIISDVSLTSQSFRLGQVLSGFHMVSHELFAHHNKIPEAIAVQDKTVAENGNWYSEFIFSCFRQGQRQRFTRKRIEDVLPSLKTEFKFHESKDESHVYRTNQTWTTETRALAHKKKHGLKLINIGGHELMDGGVLNRTQRIGYFWRGIGRTKFLPTLTCTLLTSFVFASISRYRPQLVDSIMNSPIQLLHSAFMLEADCVFIPAMRNLLYREETIISGSRSV